MTSRPPNYEYFQLISVQLKLNNEYHISLINTPGVYYYFHTLNTNILYLNNATVQYYSRVCYYFYTYKQLYVISSFFFDNLAIVSRMTLLRTASDITSLDNAPVH